MVLESLVTVKCKDRRALCKAVALNALESDVLEEREDLGINRSAAQDDESHPAAEYVMDLLEELSSHLVGKMQSISELDTLLKLLCLLGVSVDALHYLLVEQLEHDRNHKDTSRLNFLDVLGDVSQSFADGNRGSSIDLA